MLDEANAKAKLVIGMIKKLAAIPKQQVQPTAGRQPLTNNELCCASVLLISSCALICSCAFFSAIVAISCDSLLRRSLSGMNFSRREDTGPIRACSINSYLRANASSAPLFLIRPERGVADQDSIKAKIGAVKYLAKKMQNSKEIR
jgi:hypothetical protein